MIGEAVAAVVAVSIQFAGFSPARVDALVGDTVEWANAGPRQHTVTADGGAFGSAVLNPGDRFALATGAVGDYRYHCTIHPYMTGAVDVRRVTLGPVPTGRIPSGTSMHLSGRTADPSQPVRVERSRDGTTFEAVATATPAPSGDWTATVGAGSTAFYRAASGADVSQTRRVRVSERRIDLRAARGGVVATVTPADPYGRVLLQKRLRDRFGWWPLARKRLDHLSRATFRVRHPARLRAVLVDTDGWTPLATSRVVVLGR